MSELATALILFLGTSMSTYTVMTDPVAAIIFAGGTILMAWVAHLTAGEDA